MRQRRGVSELVASMIVLMIVSALGVMLYNISLQGLNTQENNLMADLSYTQRTAQEKFDIVSVSRIAWYPENVEPDPDLYDYIKITFYNYGPLEIEISNVYLEREGEIIPLPFTPSTYLDEHKGKLETYKLTYVIVQYYPDITKYTLTTKTGVSHEFTLSQPL